MRAAVLVVAAGFVRASHSQGIYPEGSNIPRSMTPWEQAIWALNPPTITATPPPTGPVRCIAEYETMAGILVSYDGTTSQNGVLTEMAKWITGPYGNALLYVSVDSTSERSSVQSTLAAAGVDLSKVVFIVTPTDTIWIRDYGPRYIYQGNCRAIVDHIYNRPRPNDDAFPFAFGAMLNQDVYGIPLIHGGGNFHLNALGSSHVTKLVNNENPSLSQQQIWQYWWDYQRVDTTFHNPFPNTVDSTQHIDMWMQIVADKKVVISDWIQNQGSTQDQICESAAQMFANAGWQVYRTPAVQYNGTHYTYTNVVMCNGVVMIPKYSQGTNVAQRNTDALAVFQQALPDKLIVQVDAQPLITSAGALHCVVMHIPRALGNGTPQIYLIRPNGGEVLQPGQVSTIQWAADDDKGTQSIELWLSTDGGATFPNLIGGSLPDNHNYLWTVPDIYTTQAVIKAVVRDADGNVNSDVSDAVFTIRGAAEAALSDVRVLVGRYASGGLGDLVSSDDSSFSVRPIANSNPGASAQTSILVGATATLPNPSTLDLRLESRSGAADATGELALRNWTSGEFVPVHTFAVGSTDQIVTKNGVIAQDFVRWDGRIEIKVRHSGKNSQGDLRSHFDWISIRTRP